MIGAEVEPEESTKNQDFNEQFEGMLTHFRSVETGPLITSRAMFIVKNLLLQRKNNWMKMEDEGPMSVKDL